MNDITEKLVETPDSIALSVDEGVRAFVKKFGRRGRAVSIVNIVLDKSSSMGQEIVDDLIGRGLTRILRQLKRNSETLLIEVLVRVTLFSTEVEELIAFMPLDDAIKAAEHLYATSQGVTRLDLALADAASAVVAAKQALDGARARGELRGRRKGSVILVLTDGFLTDESGHAVPFPKQLSQSIAELQERSHVNHLAIGVGSAVSEQLSAMAPSSVVKGKRIPHALRYNGDPDQLDWDSICYFIATGSSGGGDKGFDLDKEAVMAYSDFELVF